MNVHASGTCNGRREEPYLEAFCTAECGCAAGALMSLKKKKMFEMQLEQVENNIFRLNEQQNMLEGQRTTVETLVSMQNASRCVSLLPLRLPLACTILTRLAHRSASMSATRNGKSYAALGLPGKAEGLEWTYIMSWARQVHSHAKPWIQAHDRDGRWEYSGYFRALGSHRVMSCRNQFCSAQRPTETWDSPALTS